MTASNAIGIFVLVACFVFVARCPGPARADDESTELALARMVVSEAGYNPGRETFAILHVLEWRRTHLPAFRGWDIVRMGRAYCSGFGGRRNTSNPHVRQALALRPDQIPEAIQRDVHSFLRGEPQANPCPGAVHWRDRRVPARWEPFRVRCSVPTHNAYFGGEP